MMPARFMLAVFAVGLAFLPGRASAQSTGRALHFDTSVRSAGMGGASAGVTWGDPSTWGNVATLARVTGLRWEQGRSQLVPTLFPSIVFRSQRLIVGGGGIALCFSGKPEQLGRVRLDYGTSEITDVGGNVIGSFDAHEQVRGLGVAVSVPRVADEVLAWRGHDRWLAEAFDLSGGIFQKRTHLELGPPGTASTADANSRDWGLQARFSPLVFVARHEGPGWGLREIGVLDVGYGRSVLNADYALFYFQPGVPGSPPTRMERSGFSIRAGAKLPPARGDTWANRMREGLSPLLAFGFASDHDVNDGGTGDSGYEVDHTGFEISLANVFTWRRGHWTDFMGDVDGPTRGWGLGVPLGAWAGFRYDEATVPVPSNSGLPDVRKHGWTAWVDPARIYRDLRAGGSPAASSN